MPPVLLKRNLFFQPKNFSVDTDTEETLFSRLYQEVSELSLFPPNKRRKDFDLLSFEVAEYAFHDLVKRVPDDGFPAVRTIRNSYPAEDEPKIIVCLRYCADRRTGVVRRPFLFDRYRRRETGDIIDVGFSLNAEKLPGVYGERFDVTALSFRVEGVERQRRFPRTRRTRNDDKFISWNIDVDVFEVVFPCSPNSNPIRHSCLLPLFGP